MLAAVLAPDKMLRLQEDVGRACGMAAWLAGPGGEPLAGTVPDLPCAGLNEGGRVTRQMCAQAEAELRGRAAAGPDVEFWRCPAGLWEAAAAVRQGGLLLGFAMVGPARLEEPDREAVDRWAREIGLTPDLLWDRLGGLSRTSRERLASATGLLRDLVQGMVADAAQKLDSLAWPQALQRLADDLRRQDDFFRGVLDGLHEGLVFQAADGRILTWNRAAERIFGMTRDQILGRTSLAIDWPCFHPDGSPWPGNEHPSMVTLATGKPQNDVLMGIGRGRDPLRWLSINTRPVLGHDQDHPFAVVISFTDITQRHNAEEALSSTLHRLRDALESISDGFFSLDDNLVVTYFNAAAARLLGRTPLEVLGRPLFEAFPEAKGSIFEEKYREAVRDKKELAFEVFFDREPYVNWYELRVYPQKSGISVYFKVTTQDKEARKAMAESEARHRRLLAFLPDPVVVYDMEGRVTFVNPAFERVFGWRAEEVLGERLDFVPSECRHQAEQAVADMLAGRELTYIDTRRLTKDGRTLEVQLSAATLREPDGLRAGNVVILRDLTEERRAAEERQRLEIQLRQAQKMEAVGTLAGGIAHDFNNILAVILGYAELAQQCQQQGRDAGGELGQIIAAAERARDLVRQILTFSRQLQVELRPLSVNAVVRQAADFLRNTLPKMIRVELDLAEGLWPVMADANQLEQMLLSLGGNAMDAMPDGGRLWIATANLYLQEEDHPDHPDLAPGPYVRLEVGDTGVGMDSATLAHIFDPFFTTKGVGRGTGLGLSAVFGAVKGHGGHILCTSRPGAGAVFDVFLPAMPHRVSEDEAPDDRRERETVLVVDDEDRLRDLTRRVLERHGYRVLGAGSGEQALEVYRSEAGGVDLVLLDMSMPGMGGDKCFRELLAHDPGARVILASGYLFSDELNHMLEHGAMGFLAKPFRSADLLTMVREVLERD